MPHLPLPMPAPCLMRRHAAPLTRAWCQVVVVLSGSMEPGFHRGDILFLNMGTAPVRTGEVSRQSLVCGMHGAAALLPVAAHPECLRLQRLSGGCVAQCPVPCPGPGCDPLHSYTPLLFPRPMLHVCAPRCPLFPLSALVDSGVHAGQARHPHRAPCHQGA